MDNLQLHRESVARVKRPIIWERICERISVAVGNQNIFAFPSIGLTALKLVFEKDPGGAALHIKKTSFPIAHVDVELIETRIIKISYRYQRSDLADAFEWDEYLEFRVDDHDNLELLHRGEPTTIDQVTLLIMSPLTGQAAFEPPTSARRT